jgi:hypothetical protein
MVRATRGTGVSRFDEARASLRAARTLFALAVVGSGLVLAPVAGATSFTWAGGSAGRSESAAHWSNEANWEGNIAPIDSQAIETLTFPHLTSSQCTSKPPTDTCYLTLNNISGLSVESINIDDAYDYLLDGNGIALGGGGLTASPGASKEAGAFIEMPLQLTAPQKWSITSGGSEIEENGLSVGQSVTGPGNALTVELSKGSALILANDTEVGPVTIEGQDASGEHIENGITLLEEGELNSANGEPVDLRNIFFAGTGATGALTVDNSTLDVGSDAQPEGAIEASGIELDSNSGAIFKITGDGAAAGVDYSQMISDGRVELEGALVVTVGKSSESSPCPLLTAGQKYIFLSTTGSLAGSFSDAPEGGPEISINYAEGCSHSAESMRISYNRTGIAETVIGTVDAKQVEEEAKQREIIQKGSEELKVIAEAHAREEMEKKAREEAERKPPNIATLGSQEAGTTITPPQEEKSKSKPLTRAQKLTAALKQCKKQPKKKRVSCRARAEKQYGVVKSKRKGGRKT